MAERTTFLGHFGPAIGVLLAVVCGAITIGAFVAKPEGWPYVAITLVLVMIAGLAWILFASRANKKHDEQERAEQEAERARSPEMVQCGGEDAGNPFFCGKMVPLWFADLDDNGPPRCGRCISGVPGGPYQLRYPKPRETEDEYNAEARKTEAENAAIADQYEQLAKDFPLPAGDAARGRLVAPVASDQLRVAQSDDVATEEAQSEEEAASKPAKGR